MSKWFIVYGIFDVGHIIEIKHFISHMQIVEFNSLNYAHAKFDVWNN